jgi:hypothetical protein
MRGASHRKGLKQSRRRLEPGQSQRLSIELSTISIANHAECLFTPPNIRLRSDRDRPQETQRLPPSETTPHLKLVDLAPPRPLPFRLRVRASPRQGHHLEPNQMDPTEPIRLGLELRRRRRRGRRRPREGGNGQDGGGEAAV